MKMMKKVLNMAGMSKVSVDNEGKTVKRKERKKKRKYFFFNCPDLF